MDDLEPIKLLRTKMGGKANGDQNTTSNNKSEAQQLRELDGTSDSADGGMADGGHADGDSRSRKR